MDKEKMENKNKKVETDTVSGDISEKALEEDTKKQQQKPKGKGGAKKSDKKLFAKLSTRTRKQMIVAAVLVAVILIALISVLIGNSCSEGPPPDFETVRERFGMLIEASYDLNDIIWGEGLPIAPRLERDIKPFTVIFKEKEETLRYYVIQDKNYPDGSVISYEYQIKRMEDKVNADDIKVYTYYDVETGGVLQEYKQGASRFVLKTKKVMADLTLVKTADGYYYYSLPKYQNSALVYAGMYTGEEDKNYDYVLPDAKYKDTEALKNAIAEVYSDDYVHYIYENLFTGVAYSQSGVMQALYTDYTDAGDFTYLMKSNREKWEPLPGRRYDLSTMRMIEEKSNASSVVVEVESYLPGEDTRTTIRISFAKENNNWYLDSPTY